MKDFLKQPRRGNRKLASWKMFVKVHIFSPTGISISARSYGKVVVKSSMIRNGSKMIFVSTQFYSIDLLMLKINHRQDGRSVQTFYFSLPTLVHSIWILMGASVQLAILFAANLIASVLKTNVLLMKKPIYIARWRILLWVSMRDIQRWWEIHWESHREMAKKSSKEKMARTCTIYVVHAPDFEMAQNSNHSFL